MAEELISIGEAARRIGINKSTLSRQVKSGAIRAHDGQLLLSEVLEDRANNINLSQSRRRPASANGLVAKPPPADKPPRAGAVPAGSAAGGLAREGRGPSDPEEDQGDDMVLVDGVMVSFATAQRVKENYLARKHQLDFETERGSLVDRATAERAFFSAAREIRDAWIAWPLRVATLMASELKVEERALAETLSRYVSQHLAELGEPSAPEFAPKH